MPTLVTEAPYRPVPLDAPRKRWTREDCALLDSVGAFERLELVEGELINKMGKRRPHQIVLGLTMEWLTRVFGTRFVSQETPIDVRPEDNPSSEPEPDIVVLNRDYTEFRETNPQPNNIRLLVEVSDSTLSLDLNTKAALFARAGIIEYWVMDVGARRIVVHRGPEAGRYSQVAAYGDSESVAPLAAPESALVVGPAFPV